MSTTEHETDTSTSSSTEGDADATQQLRRPEAAARRDQEQSSAGGSSGGSSGDDARSKAASMRDGAMARVAPRRDLSSRRPGASRVPSAAAGAASAGSAAGASAARGRAPGRAAAPGTRPPRPRRAVGPRRVRLTVQRVDPWSVFKIALLVSVALGIAGVVAVAVLWTVLSGMNVFQTLNEFIIQVTTGEDSAATFDLMDYVGFGRVVSLAVVFGVINVILLTALATLTAFLYNVCTALVGGLHLTLSDE